MMVDNFWPLDFKDPLQVWIANVELIELGARVQIGQPSCGKIVDNDHLMPMLEIQIDHV